MATVATVVMDITVATVATATPITIQMLTARDQTTDYGLQTTDYGLQTTDYRLRTTDYRLLTIDY